MRLSKAIGIVAMALATCAVLLYTAASFGSVKETTICIENETVCDTENVLAGYEGGELLVTAEAKNAVFLTSVIKETCSKSIVTSSSSGEKGVEIKELTFSGCEPCTKVVANGLPITAEGFPTSEGNAELVGEGSMTASSCPGGISCTFGAGEIKLEALGSESKPMVLAKTEELTLLEGNKSLCGSTAKWSGEYPVTKAIERHLDGEGGTLSEVNLPLEGFVEPESE